MKIEISPVTMATLMMSYFLLKADEYESACKENPTPDNLRIAKEYHEWMDKFINDLMLKK